MSAALLTAETRIVGTVLVGMAVGMWWELYRGWLRGWKPRHTAVLVGDLGFWAVAFWLTALGLFWANWLDIRLYAVAGMAFGVWTTSVGTGWLVRNATAWVFRVVRRALGQGRSVRIRRG